LIDALEVVWGAYQACRYAVHAVALVVGVGEELGESSEIDTARVFVCR
jgi:hypothetical protein